MQKLFLCVGAAKAGTTWLYKQLEQNPQVCFSPEKELNYFFSRYGQFNRLDYQARYEKFELFSKFSKQKKFFQLRIENDWYMRFLNGPVDETWYRQLFTHCKYDQYASDFSPSTSMISQEGWEAAKRSADEVKLVYMMRSPVDRLWSHIKFHMAFIRKFHLLEKFSAQDYINAVEKYNLLADGRYGTHLENIYRTFDDADVKVCFFEDIQSRPTDLLHEIESFLDIPHINYEEGLVGERVNKSQQLRMPNYIPEIYAEHFEREIDKLKALGILIPEAWRF